MFTNRWLLCISLALLAAHAPAQIYRCEIDDNIVFSDQPCAENSQEYHSTGRVSVIEPAADLDQVAKRNQAFLRQRSDRQAALRQARIERSRQESITAPQAQPQVVAQVFYVPEPKRLPPRHPKERQPQRPREPTPQAREERPFSALSGPFPGTRRSDRDPRRAQ
jgi:hypothetical protein